MNKPRCCPDCGLVEDRKVDEKGREVVNLSPLTGQCVTCLGKAALARHVFAGQAEFDARARAARNDQ
jgi:hypothetical protein